VKQAPDPWVQDLLARVSAEDAPEFLSTALLLQALGEHFHDGVAKRRLRRCMDAVGWMPAKNDEGTPGYRAGRYAEQKRSQMSQSKSHSKDEFGVLEWPPRGETPVPDSPFEARLLDLREANLPTPEADAAAGTFDALVTAQSIAVTLFGASWYEHVFEVYDRLQKQLQERMYDAEMQRREAAPEAAQKAEAERIVAAQPPREGFLP
jgi:hypothetical protein